MAVLINSVYALFHGCSPRSYLSSDIAADLLKIAQGALHDAASAPITTSDATDLPTAIVLANVCKASYNAHLVQFDVHIVADATNVVSAANATDQGTVDTLLNAIKAAFNAHAALLTSHPTADATNAVATADATDLASSIALVNALKAKATAHYARAVLTYPNDQHQSLWIC